MKTAHWIPLVGPLIAWYDKEYFLFISMLYMGYHMIMAILMGAMVALSFAF